MRIVTRGFGTVRQMCTRGYGDAVTVRFREVLRLVSRLTQDLLLRSPWRKET